MRLTCIILVLVLVNIAITSASWISHLKDFEALLPKDRIKAIGLTYYLFDREFRKTHEFLKTDFYPLLYDNILKSPEVIDVLTFLEIPGYEVAGAMIVILQYLEYADVNPNPLVHNPRLDHVQGFTGFVSDVADILPDKEIANLAKQKLIYPEFARGFEKLGSNKLKALVYRAKIAPSMAAAISILSKNGIFIDPLLKIVFRKLDLWTTMVNNLQEIYY